LKLLHFLPVDFKKIKPENCVTTESWVKTSGAGKWGASYKEIYPARRVRLGPPKTIDSDIHWAFRGAPFLEEAPAFVGLIPRGRLWSDAWCRDGAVITPDNKVLTDVSFQVEREPEENLVFSRRPMPPLYRVKGTVADLTSMAAGANYYHWMLDVLPKIHLLRKGGLFSGIDRFIISGRYDQPIQRETLGFLGIPKSKVIESETHPYIKADMLIATTFLFSMANIPGWKCDFLREAFLGEKDTKKGSGRVYISREDVNTRKVVNEEEVTAFLSGFGFEKHVLTPKPVSEKIKLFSSAEITIGPHGAGLSNIIFCGKGARVVELFPPEYLFSLYVQACQHAGLEYHYLVGKGRRLPEEEWHKKDKNRDITVDIRDLEKALKLAGIEK